MKTSFIIFLKLFCFSSSKLLQNHDDFEFLAINSIIKSQLAVQTTKIDFVDCGTNERLNKRIIQQTLFNKSEYFSTKLKSCSSKKIELENSAVLTFDSAQQFNKVFPKIYWTVDKWGGYPHVVHIANSTIDDIRKYTFVDFFINEIAFLMNKTEKSIDLVTTFLFTQKKCRKIQFVTINRFDKDTKKWDNDNFYPKKYRNFHKCPVRVGVTDAVKSSTFDKVVEELSEVLNFEVEFVFRKNPTRTIYDI